MATVFALRLLPWHPRDDAAATPRGVSQFTMQAIRSSRYSSREAPGTEDDLGTYRPKATGLVQTDAGRGVSMRAMAP